MSNFLGVISDSKPVSPVVQNLSFAELEYFTELLMADTISLVDDFQRKSEAIKEQEIKLNKNIEKILALEQEIKILKANDNILEGYLCVVCNEIEMLDQEVIKMNRNPSKYICKCIPKPYGSYLESLVKISGNVENIRNTVETASVEASQMNHYQSVFVS